MNNFYDRVAAYMKRTGQATPHARILVGVSGGIDSVVLLDVLCELGYVCDVIHVNFQLRGSDSEGDEQLVREACAERNLRIHVHPASARFHARNEKCSIQMAARDLRYNVFAQIADLHRISAVAVGHHSDDQAESLLINLNRGTGPEGMVAMRPRRSLGQYSHLIRPLLAETRDSVRTHAEARKLTWREDASNDDDAYLRSRIRSRVMPHLNSQALARSASLMGHWVEQVIRPMIAEQVAAASEGQSLKIDYIRQLPDILARRVVMEGLRKWMPWASVDEVLVERIMDLMGTQSGKRVEVGPGAVWRDRKHLMFADLHQEEPVQNGKLSVGSDPIHIPQGLLQLDLIAEHPTQFGGPDVAWLDAATLTFPLTIRNWRPGDRIHPLGMQGTKKVSDILTDAAVPASVRSKVTVVCSGDTIAWIVGYRLSQKFRVTTSTQKYARIYLSRSSDHS